MFAISSLPSTDGFPRFQTSLIQSSDALLDALDELNNSEHDHWVKSRETHMVHNRWREVLSFMLIVAASGANAEKKYGPGASDTEIKLGNIAPYSGPLSPYALIPRTIGAYFEKINAEGGVNGR